MFGGLTLKELASKTCRDVVEDDAFGRAAQLAYYFTLAFFPMLIFVLSLMTFVPGADNLVLGWLRTVMPQDAMSVVESWVKSVFRKRSGSVLSFSLVFSLWAASYGVSALMAALNKAYEVEEGRPFWKAQLVALGLTITLGLMVIGGTFIIIVGEKSAGWIAEQLNLESTINLIWGVFNHVVGFAMLAGGMAIIYYFAPNVKQKWSWTVPGTLFALLAFLVASFMFSLYLRFVPSYSLTYGSLGTFIVLMIWLYLLGLIMCIGGEINAEIRRTAGERVVEKTKPEPKAAR
jgi:membrane protein